MCAESKQKSQAIIMAGDAIGAVESVKSAADINAPISCKVVQVDEQGVKDLESLMDAEAYKAFVGSEH
ncbi:hypothetical protein VdG1_03986 [Verticillium dahliae VDG1]|nr:hypothetical protein VdG1_03986 [Verticillium dahliae VDG1]